MAKSKKNTLFANKFRTSCVGTIKDDSFRAKMAFLTTSTFRTVIENGRI